MSGTVLWDHPNSSASYRVRIGLHLTGEGFERKTVDLLDAEQRSAAHLGRNPQGLVPVLDIDGQRLTQSLAILDYLDRTRGLGLLSDDPVPRAKAQALAHVIAVDLHPVCNLSVATHATGADSTARAGWMQHFIGPALGAFEAMLGAFPKADFATGSRPGLADLCLIPQLYNARRWDVAYHHFPRIMAIEASCAGHPAFKAAHPNAEVT